jgi:hypothetical protein
MNNGELYTQIGPTARHFNLAVDVLESWIADGLVKTTKLKGMDGEPVIESAEMKVISGLALAKILGQKIDGDLADKLRTSGEVAAIFGAGPRGLDRDAAVHEFIRRRRAQVDADVMEAGAALEAESHQSHLRALFTASLEQFARELAVILADSVYGPKASRALAEILKLVGLREDGLVAKLKKVAGK